MSDSLPPPRIIGTLNEQPLHAAIKRWLARPGDRFEVPVGRYVIDIVRGDLLIEIQTRRFGALRRKLPALAADHPVRLVFPLATEKWIVRLDPAGQVLGRRKSPRRGAAVDLFAELTSLPALLAHPNVSLEVLLIHEEEQRRHDPSRGWRRGGWIIHQRDLIAVVGQQLFTTPDDLAALLPPDLPCPFTTADLARAIQRPRRLAQQMAYCLRALGVIEEVGRSRAGIGYRHASESPGDSPQNAV